MQPCLCGDPLCPRCFSRSEPEVTVTLSLREAKDLASLLWDRCSYIDSDKVRTFDETSYYADTWAAIAKAIHTADSSR